MAHHGESDDGLELLRRFFAERDRRVSAERDAEGTSVDLKLKADLLNHALNDEQEELQGEFPYGKLNANDKGAVALIVGHEKDRVVVRFAVSVLWVGFTPEQAVEIAQMLIMHARRAGYAGIVNIEV